MYVQIFSIANGCGTHFELSFSKVFMFYMGNESNLRFRKLPFPHSEDVLGAKWQNIWGRQTKFFVVGFPRSQFCILIPKSSNDRNILRFPHCATFLVNFNLIIKLQFSSVLRGGTQNVPKSQGRFHPPSLSCKSRPPMSIPLQ